MTDTSSSPTEEAIRAYGDDLIRRKLIDAEIPGAVVEFDPDEAERAGAFVEDALSEADARDAEDGLEIEPADRAKLSLFAAARNA